MTVARIIPTVVALPWLRRVIRWIVIRIIFTIVVVVLPSRGRVIWLTVVQIIATVIVLPMGRSVGLIAVRGISAINIILPSRRSVIRLIVICVIPPGIVARIGILVVVPSGGSVV